MAYKEMGKFSSDREVSFETAENKRKPWTFYEKVTFQGPDKQLVIEGGVLTGEFQLQSGTAALPGLSFIGDQDTGIYRHAADVLGLATGGALRFSVDLTYLAGSADGAGRVKSSASSAADTALGFRGDNNTGLHWVSADHYQGVAGGTAFFGAGGGQTFSLYNLASHASNPVLRRSAATGQVYADSSTRRIKQKIEPLADDGIIARLRPVSFELITEPGVTQWGFIAEEVEEAGVAGTSYDADGEVANYSDRAVLAALVAEVQVLRERVAGLEVSIDF